ncbi:MAG: hypothetical protein A2Z28_04380 [Chloroflexi bacterium RBG_16_51_9]|nr:MAG: hypothetical protein A2Z28_04380 [Chloroflexi bacterium RBG_16_51_9]
MAEEKLTMSIEEAEKLLGVSRPTAYVLAKNGQIPVLRLGRLLKVPRSAFLKMLENAGQPREGTHHDIR